MKVFEITDEKGAPGLKFIKGGQYFSDFPQDGGLWMPVNISADDNKIYVPDSTYNVVNIYEY